VSQPIRDRARAAAIFVLHALVFVALAAWTWRKWPDPIVDFGRELYVPWEITRGQVLYRDIASLFGPLSPYVNALWFRLFGDSLLTLALCNQAIFAAMVFGIYHIVRTAADRLTATAAGVTTIFLFGFSQYLDVSNYSFVTPYSHEATHGLALCIALILCLYQQIATGRVMFGWLAGLCFGGVMLTKPDTSLAAIAAVGSGWIGAWILGGDARRHLTRGIPLFSIGAIVPPLSFLIYFATKMPLSEALRGVAGAWATVFVPGIADSTFYQHVSGLDQPWGHTLRMLSIFAGLAVYFAALAATCWTREHPSFVKRLQQFAMLALGAIYTQLGSSFFALPLVCAAALILYARKLVLEREHRSDALRNLLVIIWSAMAFALLAKIMLNVRILHYGFYLALPGTITGIILICWTIPRALDRRASPIAGPRFAAIAVCLIVCSIVPYLLHASKWNATRVVPIGSGKDRFWASRVPVISQGPVVKEALEYLERTVEPGSRIAVLPEGIMLNYLLRRDSPLRVINLMPPEIMAFGEDEVLRSLQATPPDIVVLIQRGVGEYGYAPFGAEARYGQRTMTWVMSNYHVTRAVGQDIVDPSRPAIQILEPTSRANSLAR
jgi:dolichyl-phosphate-mannose-protein mannosyltransferase